jgi:DNA/RNA non-specific endonuclease
MVQWTYQCANYRFGDEVRQRVTSVTGSGLRSGNPTTRLTAKQAPQPLSQYPLGSDQPGYRLEHTERGHLIGLQFGGPEHSGNLVPMYAGFNGGSGAWGQKETRMRQWLDGGNNRKMSPSVTMGYDSDESAVPVFFGVSCASECGDALPDELRGFQFHVHPIPQMERDDPDEADLERLDVLKKGQELMMKEKWFVEQSGLVSIPGSGRSLRSGVQDIQVAVGGVDLTKFNLDSTDGLSAAYASRPYAVLDYLWFKHKEAYTNFLKFAPVGKFDNTQPFSEGQKSAIRKVNILAHLGFMKSDLRKVVPDVEPYENLYVGSADASGQVDHITGKQGAGSNCYSNARLVSKVMNLALNRTGMQESVNAIYENPKNWPWIAQLLNAFWTGF